MRPNFLIFTAIIGLWSLSVYFYNEPILLGAFEWLKAGISLTIIAVLLLLYFIVAVSDTPPKKIKIPLAISAISGVALILILFANIGFIKNQLTLLPSQSIIFFLVLFIYLSLGAAILLERLLKSSGGGRFQVMYMLIGFAVLTIFDGILYIFFPLTKTYLWLGPAFTVAFLYFFVLGYYLLKRIYEEAERRKEAERLAKEWKNLALAKDQFLLSLQHHLRTPITPLKGYLERILDGAYGREENPVIKEKLVEMKKITDTLYSFMENLLDIQELRMGKRPFILEDCQIENLIEEVAEELGVQAEQKGLYLRINPSAAAEKRSPTIIKADKNKLREAIWNLADNAIKYTKKGGVEIRLRVANNKLQIAIADTGIGMEKEEIDYFLQGKLFERGKEAKELYGPGRGIGLSLAVEFIKAHNGKIWAESKGRGGGTTFWIELPINK